MNLKLVYDEREGGWKKRMERLLLIDGMALLFRGYFATAYTGNYRLTKSGVPTNGVYFIIRYLHKVLENEQPTHVICCWDTPEPTFRHENFELYKAQRPAPPIELIPQFDLAAEAMESMGIQNIRLAGYEADDLIGTFARHFKDSMQVSILTSDQDSLQLIDTNVHILLMQKGFANYTRFDKSKLFEAKGLRPDQIIDLKALMGDSSDNYPGIPGIGEKTAFKLLKEYDNVKNLVENKDNLPAGVKSKLEKGMELLNICYSLATIETNVPIEVTKETVLWKIDKNRLKEVFMTYEFHGMLPHFEQWIPIS